MASREPFTWKTNWLEPMILMPVDRNQSPLPEPVVTMCLLCRPSVILHVSNWFFHLRVMNHMEFAMNTSQLSHEFNVMELSPKSMSKSPTS